MTNNKPNGHMTADELIALFADNDRHPNAMNYELMRCSMNSLIGLAYGSDNPYGISELPSSPVPEGLSELAYDELGRRQHAVGALCLAIGR